MEPPETLDALRRVFDACSIPQWQGDDRLTLSVVADTVSLGSLRILESGEIYVDFDDASLQRPFNQQRDAAVPSGTVVKLHVPRTHGKLIVVRDIAHLLAIPGTTTKEPAAYVICGNEMDSQTFYHVKGESLDAASPLIRHYHQAIQLWNVLEGLAQHVSSEGALLFFGIRRTEISPGFDVNDLSSEIASQEVLAFAETEDRQETRADIFIAALSDFLRDQAPGNAFRWILRGSEILARRLKEGLAIYLAEHSPEKLADDAKASAMEFSEKLEKIIGGLETKSLSIPAALLLAAKEVEQGAGLTTFNFIIASSAIIFGVTMSLVHQSQTALLRLLATTISAKKKELQDRGLESDNPVLTGSFESLTKRRSGAVFGSWTMLVFSWVPAIGVIATMWFSAPNPPKTATTVPSPYDLSSPVAGGSAQAATNGPSSSSHPKQP